MLRCPKKYFGAKMNGAPPHSLWHHFRSLDKLRQTSVTCNGRNGHVTDVQALFHCYDTPVQSATQGSAELLLPAHGYLVPPAYALKRTKMGVFKVKVGA